MTVAVFAPELILGMAAQNFFQARSRSRHLAKIGKPQWTLTQLQFAEAKGFWMNASGPEERDSVCNTDHLLDLIKSNHIDGPPLSDEELKSRGKSDVFVKLLFMLQITWFSLQTLVRAILHYQTTAFETMTVAFVFCSLATIGFSMRQPQNVEYPVFLEIQDAAPAKEEPEQRRRSVSSEVDDAAPAEEEAEQKQNLEENSHARDSDPDSQNRSRRRLGSKLSGPQRYEQNWVARDGPETLLILFACGFGAIHCLAWNSPFPTDKERLAWRICASATTALPIPYWLLIRMENDRYSTWVDLGIVFTLVPYCLGRITIIVLAFMSFRALPADAFKTVEWNQYIPHFAA
ncbi:MAG: hypothetical protein Q9191_007945 [Dirinaria sp. TL-2023a]